MTRTRIGLDIGASGVRAAEVSMRSIPPALVRVAQAPMPEDAFSGGEVKDPEAVAEAIRELWHRGKFKSREVVLGVANQRVVVREVSVPWLAEKELKRSGEFVLPGLVKLVVQKRKARMGRNPATGEAIKIPAKTVVKARIAKQLKDAVLPRK